MGIWEKVSGVFFKEEDEDENQVAEQNDYNERELSEPVRRDVWQEPDIKKSRKPQLVAAPNGNKSMEMLLIKAKSYDDMQSIAQNIKERKVVIVNFEDIDKETAQRMVDFLSGAVFALDGVPRKVSGGTFLFSSSRVDLTGQIMEAEQSEKNNAAEQSFSLWKR